jgi:hypothetical protein
MNTETTTIEKIEVTTGLIPVINIGMYESWIDPSHALESSLSELSVKAQNQYWELFDYSAYKDEILKIAKNFFENNITPVLLELNAGIKAVNVVGIHSPKFYNFSTDVLNFDLDVDIEELREAILKADQKDLDNFLRETYKSYSGFISFMPKSVIMLLNAIEDDKDRAVSAFVSYQLSKSDFDFEAIQNSFLEKVNENIFYTEFMKAPVDKRTYRQLFKELDSF